MTIPSNRGEIRIKKELSGTGGYGSDPTLAATDCHYVEDWDGVAQRVMTQRTGVAPHFPGWIPVKTDQVNQASCNFEVGTFTVPATNNGARPNLDEALVMGGFYDDGYTTDGLDTGKDTQVYTLRSHNFTATASVASSVAIEERFFEPGGADGVGWQYLGCRSDWELVIEPTGRWMMNHGTILAKTGTKITTPTRVALTYGHDCSLMGSQASVSFVDDTESLTVGAIINATITANMGLVAQGGLHGGRGGPAQVRHIRQPATISLTMEQAPDDQFDWGTYMDNCNAGASSPNQFRMLISAQNGANRLAIGSGILSNAEIGIYVALQDVSILADVEGRRAWELTLQEIWKSPGASTGDEDAGLTPANGIKFIYSNGAS